MRWVAKWRKTYVDLSSIWADLSSTKVNASHRKSTQVGGQTKRKLNASRKLALRVHLARSLLGGKDQNQQCFNFTNLDESIVHVHARVYRNSKVFHRLDLITAIMESSWFVYLFIYSFVRSFVCLCLEMLEYSEERHTWETVEDKLDQIRWVPNTFEWLLIPTCLLIS